MPGTSLNNLRADDDTARAIAEVLNSSEQLEKNSSMNNPVQEYETPKDYPSPPTQREYKPPVHEYLPPPQREYRQPEPQYQQPPEEYYMKNYPQQQKVEDFQNISNGNNISFKLPESLKKSLMLLMILLLLNNDLFKQILSKIPFTLNEDGEYTFLMTILVSSIVTLVYSLFSYFF